MTRPLPHDHYHNIITLIYYYRRVNEVIKAFRLADSYYRWLESGKPTGNIAYDTQRRLMRRSLKKLRDDALLEIKRRGLKLPPTGGKDVVVSIRP